ncbi:hypothetical protein RhiJN_27795 [Ceratobasidium sp. AG-Ba]|nr:hypothetical protein RhiJN_27795 [Ceratobasidium sp. AG-Ba]
MVPVEQPLTSYWCKYGDANYEITPPLIYDSQKAAMQLVFDDPDSKKQFPDYPAITNPNRIEPPPTLPKGFRWRHYPVGGVGNRRPFRIIFADPDEITLNASQDSIGVATFGAVVVAENGKIRLCTKEIQI